MAFGGSGFGQTSSSLFGNPSSSLFGGAAGGGGAGGGGGTGPTNLFGPPASSFGQAIPSSNSLWPNQQSTAPEVMPSDGSRAAKWQISQIHDNASSSDSGKYLSISAMHPFRPFSVEEIRLQDYSRGDKGADQPAGAPASGFAAYGSQQSQAAFGASQSASGFGAAPGGFGAAAGSFGASASGFGAAAPAPGGFGASAGAAPASGFGAAAGGFGASSASGFGAATGSGLGAGMFGASQAAFGGGGGFGASSAPGFGASSAAGFGAAPASAFGATGFGAASAAAPSLFGAPAAQSGGGLFGAPAQQNPAAGGLFGAPAQQNPAGGLFGAPASSSGLGASAAFGAPFAGAAPVAQSAPSLFGGGSSLGGFGAAPSQPSSGAGLFGASNTGASLFGNTGGNLFSSAPSMGGGFGASSSSLFGGNTGGSLFGGGAQTGFGTGLGSSFGVGGVGGFGMGGGLAGQQQQQQQQLPQGPLEASLTANPFGDSNLFSGVTAAAPSWSSGAGASVINTAVASGQSQPKAVSVVVKAPSQPYRRARASEFLAKQNVMRRRGPGSGWFATSPMRPYRDDGSVFNVGSVLRARTDRMNAFGKPQALGYDVTPWRTEEQRIKAANIKRLVVEPMPDDPILNRKGHRAAGQRSELSGRLPEDDAGNDMVTPAELGDANTTSENPFGAFETRRASAGTESGWDDNAEEEELAEPDTDEGQDIRDLDSDVRESDAVADGDLPVPHVQAEDEGHSPGRTVPYSDYSMRQLSGSKRRSSIGSNRNRRFSRRGSIDMPTCSDPDYYMIPTLDELSRMSREELSNVEELTIGKKGMGEILWMEPVDVRGLDVDQVVQIKNREVSVYPRDDDVPPVGEGLNKPARIKLFGIYKFDKRTNEPLTDATTAAKMVGKLKTHCKKEGLKFLGYDVKTGTWTFQSNSF